MDGKRKGDVIAIFLRVERKDIAFIKFIIESYEGIGIVRTLNPHAAVIVVLATPDFAATVREVIGSIDGRVHCEEIPPPGDVTDDWLLRSNP